MSKTVLAKRPGFPHGKHLIATILTAGLWSVGWAMSYILWRTGQLTFGTVKLGARGVRALGSGGRADMPAWAYPQQQEPPLVTNNFLVVPPSGANPGAVVLQPSVVNNVPAGQPPFTRHDGDDPLKSAIAGGISSMLGRTHRPGFPALGGREV